MNILANMKLEDNQGKKNVLFTAAHNLYYYDNVCRYRKKPIESTDIAFVPGMKDINDNFGQYLHTFGDPYHMYMWVSVLQFAGLA